MELGGGGSASCSATAGKLSKLSKVRYTCGRYESASNDRE